MLKISHQDRKMMKAQATTVHKMKSSKVSRNPLFCVCKTKKHLLYKIKYELI